MKPRSDVGVLPVGDESQASLVCFSHLRWKFVWQRPQHLVSRFARYFNVYVVEEPESTKLEKASLKIFRDRDVTIMTPLLPENLHKSWGFNDATNPHIRQLVADFLTGEPEFSEESRQNVVWYYTPMAMGAAPEALDRALMVFDAMDELANFRGAPAALAAREGDLFAVADLVFAGGPSLFERRKHRHERIFCFPSGVDSQHFSTGASCQILAPEAQDWTSPVLGFYGVLDERIDFDLIAAVADLRPQWMLALIGPCAKIDASALPKRPNIAYLGARSYDALPAYLAHFDIAILPFALNEATRFISPTKTLEYLAAGKPVVSTPIKDVVDLYGAAVSIAETPAEMVECIESLLAETERERTARRQAGARLVVQHGWDRIAQDMLMLIREAQSEPSLPDLVLSASFGASV